MENINLENTNLEGQEPSIEGAETATYTEEQMLDMLQKEADRRVTQALQKQQAKFEAKIAEAEKLRTMDETQRKEYEFSQKMRDFEEQKREFTLMQNKLEASKVLSNRNLPVEFVEYIVAEDAETMMANIENFERAFKAAVNDAVSKKIASPSPKAGSSAQTGMTKEQFRKLSIFEKQNLANTNPTLYNQLSK